MFGLFNGPRAVEQVQQQVQQGAQQLVADAGNGLFSRAKAMVTGFFGGIIGGAMKWGIPIFILQATGAARPIAQALGGDELANTVANFGVTDQGVDSIARRALVSAGLGAAMGAAGGAGSGLINGNGDKSLGGSIVGIGMSLVAAAVVVGATKNGNLSLADSRDVARPATPATPTRGAEQRHS